MFETASQNSRCKRKRGGRTAGWAVVLLLGGVVLPANAEPLAPGASREEDNRTERTNDSLTAQGSWTGTVRPPAATQPPVSRTRVATAARPSRKRVRLRSAHPRPQTAPWPLNFHEIRRVLFSGN